MAGIIRRRRRREEKERAILSRRSRERRRVTHNATHTLVELHFSSWSFSVLIYTVYNVYRRKVRGLSMGKLPREWWWRRWFCRYSSLHIAHNREPAYIVSLLSAPRRWNEKYTEPDVPVALISLRAPPPPPPHKPFGCLCSSFFLVIFFYFIFIFLSPKWVSKLSLRALQILFRCVESSEIKVTSDWDKVEKNLYKNWYIGIWPFYV